MEKYYQVLKIRKGATQGEIKKAYYKLAKKYHPDANGSADTTEKFIEVNEAYEFLTNPELRRKIRFKTSTESRRNTRTTEYKRWEKNSKQKANEKARYYAQQKKSEFVKQKAKEELKFVPFQIIAIILGLFIFNVLPVYAILNSDPNKYDDTSRVAALIIITLFWILPTSIPIIYKLYILLKFQIEAVLEK